MVIYVLPVKILTLTQYAFKPEAQALRDKAGLTIYAVLTLELLRRVVNRRSNLQILSIGLTSARQNPLPLTQCKTTYVFILLDDPWRDILGDEK